MDLDYADDVVMLASTTDELVDALSVMSEES